MQPTSSEAQRAMPEPDEQTLAIFSRMFIFSALVVAGYVAIATKQTGFRRALLAAIAFVLSYSIFWAILHYEP